MKVRKLTEYQERHDSKWEKKLNKTKTKKKRRSFVLEVIKRRLFAHRPSKILSFSDLPSSLVRLAIERPPHPLSAMQSVRVSTQTSPDAVSGLNRLNLESFLELL